MATNQSVSTETPPRPAIESNDDHAGVYAYPASAQQQQLWFLDQLHPGNPAYNIPLAYELIGKLNVDALNRSLTWLVNRHENFRTRFAVRDGALTQLVDAELMVEFHFLDLTSLAPELREATWKKEVDAEASFCFDLARGPLSRGLLIKLADERHVMVINNHHAILDHLSVLQLGNEFCAAYRAFGRGAEPEFEDPSLQYPDFSVWQEEQFKEPDFREHLRQWVQHLEKFEGSLDLPRDRVRPATQSFSGRELKFSLPAALSTKVREFARGSKKTAYVTLLTAFKCLLSRYTGRDDIMVGSPFSNRLINDLEGVMGCCMNTLPLGSQLGSAVSFIEAMEVVHRTVLDAYERQRVPFRLMLDSLKLGRDPGVNPVFQVLFTLQDAPMSIELEGLRVNPLCIHNGTSKFDISAWVWETSGQFHGLLEYNTDIFDPSSMDRVLQNFETLIANAVARPASPWRELPMVHESQAKLLLGEWNATAMEFPRDRCLHQLIEDQVAKSPDAVAVVYRGEELRYRDLDLRAGQLARRLRALGVGPGALIGVFVERSIDMVVAVLGVLKSGAAYVPMDPAFPVERLGWMIEDAAMPVIVTQTALQSSLPSQQARLLFLDQASTEPDDGLQTAAPVAEDLAYVIFTSGSTGRPKGVQIPHRAVVNFLTSMRVKPGMKPDDVLLSVTTLSFDIAMLELFLPLSTGARVVIANRQTAFDANQLQEEMKRVGVTVMQATPITWRLLLAAGWTGDPKLKVLVGGEAVPRDLVNRLAQQCGSVWNMYGPTETTIWSATGKLESGNEVVSIGRPIANTQIHIVNEFMQVQPAGVPGELLIGGDGLARGYLNRAELTAEKFVPNPFGNGRVYRTGDLAKWRMDGTIECLGRIDNQVKLRGFRIELGEIETALAELPDVAQAVVILRDEQLIACVIPASLVENGEALATKLREQLSRRLPEYMVPAAYVVVERFPLTPNGKIDRKKLREETGGTLVAAAASYAPPRTETERKLVAIWEQELRHSPVGIHDDFFSLGGHSLMAVRVFAEIERQLGRKLPLATLFSKATIAGLAAELEPSQEPAKLWGSLVPIQSGGERIPLFLVHGAGGNILLYRDLVARLGPHQPVYGFQSRGLDGRSQPLSTIEEMAEAYVAELKSARSAGPYCLAGYCLGGMVAYQMAKLLRESGHEVALVGLFDTYNPAEAGQAGRLRVVWQRAKFHVSNTLQLGPRTFLKYVREKFRVAMDGELSNVLGMGRRPRAQTVAADSTVSDGRGADGVVQQANDQAVTKYKPARFDGSIVIFKPKVNYDFLPDPKLGWGGMADGGVEVEELPVNPHAMLVEPFVEHLAVSLRAKMDRYMAHASQR